MKVAQNGVKVEIYKSKEKQHCSKNPSSQNTKKECLSFSDKAKK